MKVLFSRLPECGDPPFVGPFLFQRRRCQRPPEPPTITLIAIAATSIPSIIGSPLGASF